jgi:uncharacterized protein YjiS (DUF1127 family)
MTTLETWLEERQGPRANPLAAFLEGLVREFRLRQTIRHVEGLDDHLLRDIGLEHVAEIRRALHNGRRF